MSRGAFALVLVLFAKAAVAAELPPGVLARLGDDRFRAGGRVHHLALAPDGKRFVTTRPGERGTLAVAVWDASTGRPLRTHETNSSLFRGLAWGPGGAFAAVVRAEAERRPDDKAKLFPDDFRVWDLSDPKADPQPVLPTSIQLHGSDVVATRPKDGPEYTDVLFSTDGRRVAARWKSAEGKHAVHVFDLKPTSTVAKLTRVGLIDLGAEGADALHLSADGQTLVAFRKFANENALTATAWDVATGKPAKPVRAPFSEQLIPTPDASALVVFVLEEAEWGFDLFELATAKRRVLTRRRYDGPGPKGVSAFAFAPSGRELVAAVDGKTFVIDVIRGKELGRLEGHADAPCAVAVSADGTTVATADGYGLVRLWDANTLRPLNEVSGHRAPVRHAELSPDGKRLLTWAEDETVRLWDVSTGKELRAFPGAVGTRSTHPGFEATATFTPDGTTVLFSTKHRLTARDLITGLEVPLPGDMAKLEEVRFAVFAPDGTAAMTWAEDRNHSFPFEVWDWPSGKKRLAVDDAKELKAPGFSPDGSTVYTDASRPQRWDAKTGKPLAPAWRDERNEAQFAPLLSLRPNPRWLLREFGRDARVIEAGTGGPVSRFRLSMSDTEGVHLPGDRGVAVSPVSGRYAWAWQLGGDEVHISEPATCTVRYTLKGHRGEARVLGFAPDGSRLLTTSGDHTVLVWDVRLQNLPLPDAIKKETDAAKLWGVLATGKAEPAYLAMARLAREPAVAVKLARLKLRPVAKGGEESDAVRVADARAIELLEALDLEDARALLAELAGGHGDAFRTQEAQRALDRNKR